jgi:hypothetical protein
MGRGVGKEEGREMGRGEGKGGWGRRGVLGRPPLAVNGTRITVGTNVRWKGVPTMTWVLGPRKCV